MTDRPSIEGLRQAISRIEIPEDQYALYRAAVLAGDLLLPVLGVEEACDKALLQVRQGVQPPADELLEAGLVEQAFTDELEALRERDQRAGLLALRLDTAARASRDEAYAEVEALRAENEALKAERDSLKMEAQIQAQEARTANATIAEIYQVITGSTGEPGNWHGAVPVREAFTHTRTQLTAERARADALAARVEALEARVDDLSMLVRQLVHSLNKYNPGSSTATRAMDYLHRNCLQGSILRSSESQDAHDARVRREALGTSGVEAIAAERKRQMEVEGWTPEHDDEHDRGQMAAAAACYAVTATEVEVRYQGSGQSGWPWGNAWWKPKDRRSNLVRAGALIAAEIDRLDRKAAILGPDTSAARGEG